jgi:hypothetical protein
LPFPAHRQFDAAASQEQKWSRTFAPGSPSNMIGGDEVKISELLLAELDPTVGIRKTLERVPELSAQLSRHALIRPRRVPA